MIDVNFTGIWFSNKLQDCKYILINVLVNTAGHKQILIRFDFMVFNATFNNISVISWRLVLLVEEKKKVTIYLSILHRVMFIYQNLPTLQ